MVNESKKDPVKVFISYSWDSEEHKDKVLALSDSLRRCGIDCQIDRYHQAPSEGWYRWMMDQIEDADYVLVVCTEKYHLRYRNKEERGQGRGVTSEGELIIANLYDGQGINERFIPILLSPEGEKHIPRSLQAYTVYRLFDNAGYDLKQQGGYRELYRHLTKQPAHVPPEIGEPQLLPPISGASFNLDDDGEIIQAEEPVVRKRDGQERQNQLEQRKFDLAAATSVATPMYQPLEESITILQPANQPVQPEVRTQLPDSKEAIAFDLLSKLFDALYSHKLEVGIQRFEAIAHKSLFSDGNIDKAFIKKDFSPSFAAANRYKRPVQIISSKLGRTRIGSRANKEDGEEIIYLIARNDNLGGLPGQVRIFFPANQEAAKISGLSL